jgi:nuclear transport factor 2 (NTF2) superfamily protein
MQQNLPTCAHHKTRIAIPSHMNCSGQWYRAYGNENWEFDEAGLMRKRVASINESPIADADRRIAVEGGGPPLRNNWLAEQGTGKGEFPLRNGSQPCY